MPPDFQGAFLINPSGHLKTETQFKATGRAAYPAAVKLGCKQNRVAEMTAKYSNPWVFLGSTTVFENPWIRVEEHDVTNPSGGRNLYGKVHFKNQAVGVVPIDQDGNTWLVGQYRYPLNQYSWEIPEGGSPVDEDITESAARELAEETGLTAGRLELFLELHTTNSVSDEEGYVFVATDLTPGPTAFDETEDITVRKLPLAEAIRMAADGEITDAISLAALFKLAALGYPEQLSAIGENARRSHRIVAGK